MPGTPGIDYAPNFKNIAAFWTETALYQYATPHEYTLRTFRRACAIASARPVLEPWPPGWWRLRDAVDYMETAIVVMLEYAAKCRIRCCSIATARVARKIARGLNSPPYAYVIPQEQRDVVAPLNSCVVSRSADANLTANGGDGRSTMSCIRQERG
jgi:hypothetical protein